MFTKNIFTLMSCPYSSPEAGLVPFFSRKFYLSGAAKRKQRQIRNQNEAKSRRTPEDLNNKSQSQGVEISRDEVVCEDDTTSANANTITTTHITTDLDETIAGRVTEVTVGETIPIQVWSSDAERTISPLLSNDPSSWKNAGLPSLL